MTKLYSFLCAVGVQVIASANFVEGSTSEIKPTGSSHVQRNGHLMPASSAIGNIDHIRWKNGTILDEYAAQITLDPSLTKHIQDYCKKAGIFDLYKKLFAKQSQNALQPESDSVFASNDGMNWYLQRPNAGWKSNMHWLSGNDEAAAENYMDLLGEAGFDMVLDALGNFFDLDGIDCYSVGFIGVSECHKSFVHTDFENVNGKAFNILIPLQLVEESDPEFVIETLDGVTVPIHYEYNTAFVVGDGTWHGTGTCDYTDDESGSSFRLAMSIYVADTNEDNVDAVIRDYTDPFPPASASYLLNRAGKHWKKDGSVRLLGSAQDPQERTLESEIEPNHEEAVVRKMSKENGHTQRNDHLMPASSAIGNIDHIRWKNGTILDEYAAQITLDPSLTKHIQDYCKKAGIFDLYKKLFAKQSQNALQPESDSVFASNDGMNWYLQRPNAGWKSNMHWLSGNDEAAAENYMDLLGEAGFDMVLDALGNFFDLDGIDCYSVGFIGVSECHKSFVHTDFENVNGKAFNILIPLQLVEESDPEFVIETLDGVTVPIHYEYNTAFVVGDGTWHGTGTCDYTDDESGSSFRLAMSIYVADTNEDNVDAVIQDYTDPFPPASASYLLNRAGKHWRKDGSVRLLKSLEVPSENRIEIDIAPSNGQIFELRRDGGSFGNDNKHTDDENDCSVMIDHYDQKQQMYAL